jgi:transposase
MSQTLLPIFPAESTQINEIISFVKREGAVWYFHGCMPVFSHREEDYRSFNMYTSQLVVLGQCKQVEIVKAFGVSSISVKRHVKKYREGGAGAFFQNQKGRKATVLRKEILSKAQEMLNTGMSRNEVAELLEVKQDTLYRGILSGKLVECKKKVKPKVSVV